MKVNQLLQTALITGCVICLAACGNNKKETSNETADSSKTTVTTEKASTDSAASTTAATPYKKPTPTEKLYNDMRMMAFTTTPVQLKIATPADQTIVYGVIIDQEDKGKIVTLTAYITGDASLYLSTGGGIMGGGKRENVNSVARKFVETAQNYFTKTTKAKDTVVPNPGMIKFYLLTNKGIYVADEAFKNITDHSSPWIELYDQANQVIKQLNQPQ